VVEAPRAAATLHRVPDQPCLVTVHAHPDDEASKGAATVARYAREGVRTVLVCCTGGEEGDILNPAMDTPDVRADLARVRAEELRRSAEAIGFDEVVMLGYRDSGMPGTEANANPASFGQAPLEEAIGRLVAVVRRVRPQVLITYGPDHDRYPHPDHIRTHEIGVAAFHAAGDPAAHPGTGEPWTPAKLYYSVWSRQRIHATHAKMVELGIESPYSEEMLARSSPDEDRVTTRIDIRESFGARTAALLAHATQIDPTSAFWFGLPDELAAEAYPYEDFVLAESRVGMPPEDQLEDDLFAGVPVARRGAA
jgi:mycothiol S-conjugate amidase